MVDKQQVRYQANVGLHYSTTNQSFIDMHNYLKMIGIKNNAFFLALYDQDLASIDPRDPNLNIYYKNKVLKECINNYWYFLREIVRIPDEGGVVGSGVRYKLHRGNLALNFSFIHNWNIFTEFPRQHYKTVSALCRYLWVFNFKAKNSEILFMNKKHEDSKMNLSRLKKLRDCLPSYLVMKEQYGVDNKKLRGSNSVEMLSNPTNGNKITTKASAKNRINAMSLGRGCTSPLMYYDEYAFIPYNYLIYSSATPAISKASENAKRNNSPYGILITTTPGDLTTDEGMDAFDTKNNATKFTELFYDKTDEELEEILRCNTNSNFVYIRFTYQQLGSTEEYFLRMVRDLKKDWVAIRREVLLEWTNSTSNSPFHQTDLDIVKSLVKTPIRQIMVGKFYTFNVYKDIEIWKHPPIIGVDVSGGYYKDSSAITVIDSSTTEVAATFNCNYIPITDLAKVIYDLIVNKGMTNAIVNVELNGGYGNSVTALLREYGLKKNLYYEIKDRVTEERHDGINPIKKSQKVKSYGFDETKSSRELLMEILRDRMDHHKDKFIDKTIYEELCTLEVKKNGRIEHSSNGHDDQIFSLLMALYVWYYGKDLIKYGIKKTTIYTDEAFDDDELFSNGSTEVSIADDLLEDDDEVKEQLAILNSSKAVLMSDFEKQQVLEDKMVMENLKRTRLGMKAYCETYNTTPEEIPDTTVYTIPDSVFFSFYSSGEEQVSQLQTEFMNITDAR